MDNTLLLPAVIALMVAAVEWRSARAVACAALAAGFVLCAGLTPLVLGARLVCAGCFLFSVARSIREAEIPW